MVKHRSITAALGCLLMIGVGSAHAAEGASPEIDGKALLEKNCARCHSIEATGDSPLKGAPPLREVYLKYPIEMLQYDLAEGWLQTSRHAPDPILLGAGRRDPGLSWWPCRE